MSKRRNNNLQKYLGNPPVVFMSFLRILSALSILIFPLGGFVAYAFLDIIDWRWFVEKGGMTYKEYHFIDKCLDWVGYLGMIAVAPRFGMYYFEILLALLLYRLIGQIIFFRTNGHYLFVLFPNFFESTYVWVLILSVTGGLITPPSSASWNLLLILSFIQMIRELYLHIFCPWYLRHYKYPKLITRFLGVKNKGLEFLK